MPHQHQLSPDQEQIFLLRFASEMEYQEIASQLKTSRGLWRKPMSQIYMILIILWNGHLDGMGIWLWNGHLGGMGIWLWNGHLARYNSQAGRMPTPLIFIPPLSNARNLTSQGLIANFHQ
ncbi:sigma-70 region 4 domain-containing protein [Moorena sp. SIO3I6]|uniref:sigma-70 region 4 domain-containing protein n=1 Tax=Moorena sp. SIO3I6 TaxID=2607831 RepID=UPI0025D765FD|nr:MULTISPECIES: sigma-70 region 4 domain-containing protein [unclassified Moorena]